ncbi:MAG: NUDIX hydrolase [bacterium]|nr:NUDIX hydrolase [bacterium]
MDPYERRARAELYRNPWLAFEVHEIVHPTGVPGEHGLLVTPPASAVLVVDRDAFIFARQPRFAARDTVIEVVKGGAEPGETALACAKRELREELGMEAATWTALGRSWEIPSIVAHPVAIFLASDLRDVASEQEDVERVERLRIARGDAYEAALDGRIDDAITLAALLRYRLLAPT